MHDILTFLLYSNITRLISNADRQSKIFPATKCVKNVKGSKKIVKSTIMDNAFQMGRKNCVGYS